MGQRTSGFWNSEEKRINDVKDKKDPRSDGNTSFFIFVPFVFSSFKEAALTEGFILPHGGYKEQLPYKKAQIVYDATVRFCERYIQKR